MKTILATMTLFFVFARIVKAENILLQNITFIDPASKTVSENQNIYIRDGKIVDVVKSNLKKKGTLNPSFRIFDGTGKYVLPGFVETHTHLVGTHNDYVRDVSFIEDELKILIINGITTVRNMKSYSRDVLRSNEIEKNDMISPRIVVASPAIDDRKDIDFPPKTNFHCWKDWSNCTVINASGRLELMTNFKKDHFEWIKLREPLSPENFRALSKSAKKLGFKVGGHIDTISLIPEVFESNLLDSIEHFYFGDFLEAESSPFKAFEKKDLPFQANVMNLMFADPVKVSRLMDLGGKNFKGYLSP